MYEILTSIFLKYHTRIQVISLFIEVQKIYLACDRLCQNIDSKQNRVRLAV